MPKINQEEYEVLRKVLSDGYEWIARDSHNPLCTHRHKPVKQDHWIQQYWGNVGNGYKEIDNRLFQFIQWEDEEPYNIQELVSDYEYKTGTFDWATALRSALHGESEEIEVKNMKWFKKKLDDIEVNTTSLQNHDAIWMLNRVHELYDQLDEPEVLSQEWIDEHEIHYNHWVGAVPVTDLQNLLVPKQELPVIPKFVAEFIESYDGDFYSLLYDADNISSDASLVTEEYYELGNWLSVNSDELLQAVANGYEVERQPQYRLKAGDNYLYFNLDGTVRGATKGNATITKRRLGQLPFDVEKAVESGIIEVEELEE